MKPTRCESCDLKSPKILVVDMMLVWDAVYTVLIDTEEGLFHGRSGHDPLGLVKLVMQEKRNALLFALFIRGKMYGERERVCSI